MPDDIIEKVEDAERAPFNQIAVLTLVCDADFLAWLESFADERGIKSQGDAILQAAQAFRETETVREVSDAYRDHLNTPREPWQNY